MSLRTVLGEDAIKTSALRAAGTYSSGPIFSAGKAGSVVVLVHISAVGGSTQTLDVKLQSSPDASTWADIAGAASTQLTAVGSTSFNALVNDAYVQAVAVLGGTGSPTATFRVAALVLPS
jgi:hypothetical protein